VPKTKTSGNLALADYNDIFASTTTVVTINEGHIVEMPLSDMYPPEFHPFQVNDDLSMYRLSMNITKHGIREPGLVRPRYDGGYELLCGNRRKRACELAGISTMPVIVREMDDDDAVLVMVDSNLEQREKILPSERAWAFRVMMEALNHRGVKSESNSYEIMIERTGVKKSQLFRIIRLTELIVVLIDKVDANQLAFNPAVELSYLTQKQQTTVADVMAANEVKPSLSQAQRLKKLSQSGELTDAAIDMVLSEEKKPSKTKQTDNIRYRSFFPQHYSTKQIDGIIIGLLKDWKAKVTL